MPLDDAFADVTNQVHILKDIILYNMRGFEDEAFKEADLSFSRRLITTKAWFSRLSSCNKKHFLLTLLKDIKSGWTLSLMLKSIWNCRPKDAVCSVAQPNCWSSYDVSPLDHNRAAAPWKMLLPAMQADREWFITLEPEPQAMFMLELLSVAGAPVMWAILDKGQKIYEKYRDDQLLDLQECSVILPQKNDKPSSPPPAEKLKRDQSQRRKNSFTNTESMEQEKPQVPTGKSEEILNQHLAQWGAIMTSMKDSLKLEEVEMTFRDGTKRNIWKVNRPKPEIIETVDIIQLLPSYIAKLILSYIPRAQLPMYASVNKYWAYLIDELKEEFNIRAKIDLDIQKLESYIVRNEPVDELSQPDLLRPLPSAQGITISTMTSSKAPSAPHSRKASVKSVGLSLKNMMENKPKRSRLPPIRNMAELSDRLDTRGAADENLVKWCQNVLEQCKNDTMRLPSLIKNPNSEEGVIPLQDMHFPSPLMKQAVRLPLVPPLIEDPSIKQNKIKPKPDFATVVMTNPKNVVNQPKFSMWSRDLSSLYPACKIASYHYPV